MIKLVLTIGLTLLRLNNPDGVYASGDTVRIYACRDSVETLVHEKVYDGPQRIIYQYEDTSIGFVVDTDGFEAAYPCPRDFDRYWRREIRAMRKIPAAPVLKAAAVKDEGIECSSIELACVDGTPVRGFIAMPKDAARKSLPIVVFAHAAGVAGQWCRAYAEETAQMARWGGGAIVININAFGMLNDQPQSYYDELENGIYKDYSRRSYPSRESYIFRGMFLRLVRALDYACSLDQWDGRRVMTYGQSQGGCQALALAGLDKRVSCVVGIVPGGCALTGYKALTQPQSWPWIYNAYEDKDLALSILPYFDCINLSARTDAEMWIEIGLQDQTCMPEAIWSAINANSRSVKHIVPSPYRYHDEPSPRYWQQWWDTVHKDRMAFVNEYLK